MELIIGKKLKNLRRSKDLTQEEVASHLGISFQAISKWERGEGYPDITMLPILANYFHVTIKGEKATQTMASELFAKLTSSCRVREFNFTEGGLIYYNTRGLTDVMDIFEKYEIDDNDSLDDKSLFELLSTSISSPVKEEDEVINNTGKYVNKKEILDYIERVKNCGLGKAKSLDFISKYIKSMNSYDSIE